MYHPYHFQTAGAAAAGNALLQADHVIVQLLDRPDVLSEPDRHCWSRPQLLATALFVRLSAEVVVRQVKLHGPFEVLQLL